MVFVRYDMAHLLTCKGVRESLTRMGKTAADIARELEVSPAVVRGVIDGRFKGNRGDAHKVAVALGLKDGLIVDGDTPIAEAIKAAIAA